MQKHLYIIILLFLPLLVNAQDIKIVSFAPDVTDMTANLEGTTVYDQNGDKCALIKIETTEKGFTFDVGVLGIVKTEHHLGEIWLYVPYGVKNISISHPTLGIVRDQDLGMSVKQARTYILKLVATKVHVSNPALMQQFVVFNVTPTNSYVEFDGEPLIVQNGKAHKLKPFGTYKYTVSSNNYHTQTGEVTISDVNNRKEVEVNLLPAFGQLNITSENLQEPIYTSMMR